MDHTAFSTHESGVTYYNRIFPRVFRRAEQAFLHDEAGHRYIDFFSGAGALNYGHNHPAIKQSLISYLQSDGIVHGMDMLTVAKRSFLEKFQEVILKPRNLNYKIQFPGPTGTNAVEAALKLARKVTGRSNVVAFTNSFHGMTLGALAASGNRFKRAGAGTPLSGITVVPYDNYFGKDADTVQYLRKLLLDEHSGVDFPAAVIVETIQAEGGINTASILWLRELQKVCNETGVLLIIDDIQTGCGRCGTFFSFEDADLYPDIVCLSKSLSGCGLPLSMVLMKPEWDVWEPGEHNGTFRGCNLSFVAAEVTLDFWANQEFPVALKAKSRTFKELLTAVAQEENLELRGSGFLLGLRSEKAGFGRRVVQEAFQRHLILESCGPGDSVLKVMPPLIIDEDLLREGVGILRESIDQAKSSLSEGAAAPALPVSTLVKNVGKRRL